MARQAALLLLLSSSLFAAEYRTGQAARAVLGQSSFASREAGVTATSLVVSGTSLYVSDVTQRVLTFDVSGLGNARADRAGQQGTGCGVCLSSPIAQTRQPVSPGVAAVSVWNKSVAVADPANRRVLLWRDATDSRPDRGPDVILGRSEEISGTPLFVSPVSVALDGKRLFVGDAALHRVLVWNTLPLNADQPPDAVLGQPDLLTTLAPENAAADTVATPAAMTSDGENLYVADASANRILVFAPADSVLARESVLNSASLLNGPLAPGTLITISGKNLSESTEAPATEDEVPLSRKLAGVEAVFDGIALPLVSVSPEEVQALLPRDFDSRGGASLYLRSERAGTVTITNAIGVRVAEASPGLFALGGKEPRSGLLLHPSAGAAVGAPPVTAENPAHAGEVLTVWATGLGAVFESGAVITPVVAQVDGQTVSVISAKLAEHSAGVYEIRIAVPAGWTGRGTAHFTVAQSGVSSNTITFPISSRR